MQVETIANNQMVIYNEGSKYFWSYDSLIAVCGVDGILYLTDKWDFSVTTLKYLKQIFSLKMTKAEIKKALDNGKFKHYQ